MVAEASATKLYTVEEFEAFIALAENRDRPLELIHGKIVEKMATQEHGIIVGLFATYINLYLWENPIGRAAYLKNGAKIVWLVYPAKHLIEVLTADSRELLGIDEMLDGGEVLPGFTLAVKKVFPDVS